MKQIALIITLLILGLNLNAQDFKFRDNINRDSLFDASVKGLPEEKKKEFRRMYKNGNDEEKEFLLFMISMPISSKNKLIENYEKHKVEIGKIKEEYSKLVPEKHIVYIEFEPASKILTIPEQITIKIYKAKDDTAKTHTYDGQRNDKLKVVSQNYNLKPDSKELEYIITSLGWTKQTLVKIKELLDRVNCVSIENGEVSTIGFARSGMGKYSYKLFDSQLTENQKQRYNNGCEYIFYKDNVVLEYGGGAIGPQCFEKE
ncbi:hypothetical protein [Rufibacter roseus]|uniref:Uncharacterized protein n=1 Tax=Rufibacter roseus TaxID=1567108 RepID=A0ABW2DLA5_9BACT|nr:hypothetical protein [Rufibacter roseus]